MAKEKVKDRILNRAIDLFYTKGYHNTGINQIIDESGTAKASFYSYFKSKDDLAKAYLYAHSEMYIKRVKRIMQKHPEMVPYVNAKVDLLVRSIKQTTDFNGCALGNFTTQLGRLEEEGKFGADIQTITEDWFDLYSGFFARAVLRGELIGDTDTRDLAKKFTLIYEGSLTLWRMTESLDALEQSRELYHAVLDPYRVEARC
jgi:TetR/AcrR family transcriptional repressor of lmrAB and yxaGH operons